MKHVRSLLAALMIVAIVLSAFAVAEEPFAVAEDTPIEVVSVAELVEEIPSEHPDVVLGDEAGESTTLSGLLRDATGGGEELKCEEYSVGGNKFLYSDEMLLSDARVLSTDIAKVSVALAEAAYRINGIKELKQLGYTVDQSSYDASYSKVFSKPDDGGMTIWDNDYVAYSIWRKPYGDYTFYIIPVKGTSSNLEWFSDFNLGNTRENKGYHKGFFKAACRAMDDITDVFDEHAEEDGTRVVLFTGHSRGAAVANLLAGWMTDPPTWMTDTATYVSQSHLFCYTFACPSVGHADVVSRYSNIFNYNNKGDLIPLLPMRKKGAPGWDFERYGCTFEQDLTELGNFNRLFTNYWDKTYHGESTNANYLSLLNAAIPTEADYEERHWIFDILCYFKFGGNTYVTAEEFAEYMLERHGFNSALFMFDLVTTGSVSSIMHAFEYAMDAYAEEIDTIQTLLDALDNPGELTVAEILEMFPAAVNLIKELLDISVMPSVAQARAAQNILQTRLNQTTSKYNAAIGIIGLFLDTDFQPGDGVYDGHEPHTYLFWINSKFAGCDSWAGADINEITEECELSTCTSIGARAFMNCTLLESVTLPTGLRYLGEYAFAGCIRLASPLVFPEGMTRISSHAFSKCGALPEISIPDTVTRIEEAAFNFCTSMVGGIEGIGNVVDIGDHAFYSCEALEGTLPLNPGLLNIGDYAFTGCGALEGALELPPDIQSVGRYAFSGCAGLSSLVIPATAVKSLHEAAFASCSGLKYVELPYTTEFQPPESSYWEYMDLFLGCNSVEQIVYTAGDPGIAVPEDLGEYVSYMLPQTSRSALKSVVLDAEIPNLYASMFAGCGNLESLVVSTSAEDVTFELPPNLTSIPADLLAGCYTLPGEFSLPEHVISIGDRAFQSCGLTGDLILPEEVTSIGEEAFSDCSGLTGYLTFPDSITEVGSSAFYGTGLTKVCIPGVILEIAPDLFSHCKSLQEVLIETGVTVIGDGAFERCESLRTLEIPDSTTTLGAHAFTGCEALQSVKLPISATMITYNELVGDNNVTFALCDSIEDLVYTAGDGTVFLPNEHEIEYTLIELSRNSLRRIVLPETATSLPAKLFHDCTALELMVTPDTPEGVSVRLPQGLTEIPEKLFYNCGSLSGELALPEGLKDIGKNAFYACGSLSGELALPEGLTGVGEKAFYNCGGFTGLTIPDSVITLGDGAFNGCDALTRVKMPISAESSVYNGGGLCVFTAYGVEEIEYTSGADTYTPDPSSGGSGGISSGPIGYLPGYFYTLPCQSMMSLRSVIFSDDIHTELYPHMFQGCGAIESIRTSASNEGVTFDLPKALTYIPESAFSGCSGLTGPLKLPGDLIAIGRSAFANCNGFTGKVVLSNQVIFLGWNAFLGCDQLECVAIYNRQCEIEADSETIPITISILGWENSTAQDYANAYGNEFFLLDEYNSVILSATRARLCVGDVVSPFVLVNGTESVSYALTSDNADAVVVDGQRMTMVGPGTATVTVAIPGPEEMTATITIEVASTAETLNLPSMLTLIGEGAFSHTAAERICVPAGVELVCEDAFDQCTELDTVVFAGSDTSLAEGAFDDSNCVLLCLPGSVVELCASRYNIPFLLIPKP